MKKSGPMVVQVGNVHVPIYHTPTRGRDGWTIAHYRDGRRVRAWRSDLEEAKAYAETEARRIARHEVVISGAKAVELERLDALAERARKAGVTIEALVERLEMAKEKCGGRMVPDLVEEYLGAKSGVVNGRWHEMKATMLKRFADAFRVPIGAVQAIEVQRWVDGLEGKGKGLGARSKANHLAEVRGLVEFCRRRGYVAGDWDVTTGVEMAKAAPGKIQPYSPTEAQTVLNFAAKNAPDWVPWLAVRAFSGVRFEESLRLTGRDLKPGAKWIVLEPEITKTRTRRLVPVLPALAAWLKAFPSDPDAPLAPKKSSRVMGDRLTGLVRRAGVESRHNGWRDAFISYRMAITRDIGAVADESGNSPAMIRRSYREVRLPNGKVITPALARAYFGIRPSEGSKVVRLTA